MIWFPVVFAYIFSAYFCILLYFEYKHFHEKRLLYLLHGDPNTPLQTYYTVMVEHIPPSLQSAPRLQEFFERLFPNQVFSVEICLDLHDLDEVVEHRRATRDRLEKAYASWHANGHRPKIKISRSDYELLKAEEIDGGKGIEIVADSTVQNRRSCLHLEEDLIDIDAIAYYTKLLESLNEAVYGLQKLYFSKTLTLDEEGGGQAAHLYYPARQESIDHISPRISSVRLFNMERPKSLKNLLRDKSHKPAELPVSMQDLAREGLEHARKATQHATQEAIRGVMNVTRSIELLTVGAVYRSSSTAFVTLTTRVAKTCSHQVILSHRSKYSMLKLRPAPSPKDIIW